MSGEWYRWPAIIRNTIVVVAAATLSATCLAQDVGSGRAPPPFAVSGYKYAAVGSTHMFQCQQPARCGAGSKVSYIIAMPSPKKMTFGDYKTSRPQLAAALNDKGPKDVRFKFAEPVDKSDGLLTIFEQRRVQLEPDPAVIHTISRHLIGAAAEVDIISSATDAKIAEANLAEFQFASMMFVVGRPKKK